MSAPRLHLESTALLVVDVQTKLMPAIDQREAVTSQILRLMDGAEALDVPIVITEQYPQGLGPSIPEIAQRAVKAHCCADKVKFSAFVEPVRRQLAAVGAQSVIVCGVEAHVCVLQTCLDLMGAGYLAAVVVDAVGSRRRTDKEVALDRLMQAGVLPTTVESALLEWVHEAGTDRFKTILPLIK